MKEGLARWCQRDCASLPAKSGTNDLYLACITACWVEVPKAYSIETVKLLRNLGARNTTNRAPPASEAGRAAGTTDELTPDRDVPELEGGQPDARAERRERCKRPVIPS